MLNRLGRAAAAVVALSLAAPAQAGDFHYFNKPGVSRETYKADVAECVELAGGAKAPHVAAPYSPNLIGVAVGAFFAGMMRSRERRRLQNAVERTCMADKGYARMEVDDDVVAALEKIKTDEERLDRLFALASAAEPVGRRLKE
jgi:hypothetical protein